MWFQKQAFKSVLVLVWLIMPNFLVGQSNYFRVDDVLVVKSSDTLDFPFLGGMNNPQFFPFDFNHDNINDLFIFDRAGGIVIPFINYGTKQIPDYRFNPTYEKVFPELKEWVVLMDIDCDSIPDVITAGNENRVRVLKSYWSGSAWQFQLLTDTLRYRDNNFMIDIFINKIDIPSITDINGDGDIDLLTFAPGGGYLEYFENQSIEKYGDCTHFELEKSNGCWGKFYESGLIKSVSLDSCQVMLTQGNTNREGLHVGSTVATLDVNKDGLKEAVLGDVTFDNLNMLFNDGTATEAHIYKQDTVFPVYTVSALMPTFPAAYFLPIDGAMEYDMIVAPNSRNNSLDVQNVWYYRNIGNGARDSFVYVTNNFLTREIIDVGTLSTPAFFDANGDGLVDIVIGRQSRRAGSQLEYGSLTLYENVGTTEKPAFEWVTDNYANLITFQLFNIHPTFGDIDGDGDEDMIIGEANGLLHLFVNNAGAGNPASFGGISPNYFGIDIGAGSAPQLVDIDRDQLLDLLVGEKNGNLNYFKNLGTASSASFSATPDNSFFGQVDVRPYLEPFGYSAPYLYTPDGSGNYELLVGNLYGQIYRYSNIDNNLGGAFTVLDTIFNSIDVGERATVSGGLLNADTLSELLIGNSRGGISLFSKSFFTGKKDISLKSPKWTVFPNPADRSITINISEQVIDSPLKYQLIDFTGRQLLEGSMPGEGYHHINVSKLLPGIYLLILENQVNRMIKKIVIAHD